MCHPLPFRVRAASALRRLLRDRRGATAVEYGFILALITLVIIVAIVDVADVTTNMWGNVSAKVQNAR